MSKIKSIEKEKDKTVIESLIENSKEIIRLNVAIHLTSQASYAISRCKSLKLHRPDLRPVLSDLRTRREEIKMHNATMFKIAYSGSVDARIDKFYFNEAEMAAGFMFLRKNGKEAILFLSDVIHPFLDKIEEGSIIEYTEELEKEYFPFCKSVYNNDAMKNLFLNQSKLFLKSTNEKQAKEGDGESN
jgi:hypothetical protein